tara:strand:- start:87 stop:569 length:483 start_codon:yes stop_codon:yes gene_type:complete
MKKDQKFFDKYPGLGILLFFCGAITLYTIVVSLWAIPGLALMYLVYKSSMFIFDLAPFNTSSDSFLEFMLGYNSFILSLLGVFLVLLIGITIYRFVFKKEKSLINFRNLLPDLLEGGKKFIYFWFGANVFILIIMASFFVIIGLLSSGGGEHTCNLLVCY